MTADNQRPEVRVGHIEMETDQLAASESFMITLGLRPIFKTTEIAILELRAATHLVLVAKDDIEPGDAPFDLMVDDLDATHRRLTEAGLSPPTSSELAGIGGRAFVLNPRSIGWEIRSIERTCR